MNALLAAVLALAISAPLEVSTVNRNDTAHVLSSLDGATAWLNSRPLRASDLRGKVVVVEFWTYTCINWLRTLPYVNAWADKYRSDGLVVVGVHSPEFPFEHDVDNVRRAAGRLNVSFPIAIDNRFAIWRGFDNQYWPALYIIDARGDVRHRQFGEGGYERSEAVIVELLREAGAHVADRNRDPIEGRGIEAPADWNALQSPESYLGYARAESFSAPHGAVRDKAYAYPGNSALRLNAWTLTGTWSVTAGSVVSDAAKGRIAYRFHARDLHLVLAPPRGKTARFRVFLDGRPPGGAHGLDVDRDGYGTLAEPRLYNLIRQPEPIVDRLFEIEFDDPGAAAFAFTFG